jgi:hypothetical protein
VPREILYDRNFPEFDHRASPSRQGEKHQ